MIYGIIKKKAGVKVSQDILQKMTDYSDGKKVKNNFIINNEIGLGSVPYLSEQAESSKPYIDKSKNLFSVFQGQIYNIEELSKQTDSDKNNPSQLIVDLYEKMGEDFVEKLNGKFSFVIYDNKNKKTIIGRDRVGMETMFVFNSEDQIIFSSSLASIVNNPDVEKKIDYRALYQFLLFCYNPALFTFYKNVEKLRPGFLLIVDKEKSILKRYWNLSFQNQDKRNENIISENLLELLQSSVKSQLDSSSKSGIFLSGGMDSSTVVGLSSEYSQNSLSTYSFRCLGESFDESHYAKIMADHYKTDHHLVEYKPEHVELMKDIVKIQDEPFCDLGINVATYLLAREAESEIANLFTGDGGDELFGGHPVYEADKLAAKINRIPRFLLNPILSTASKLPDSDKKKNFIVKAKRFAQSYNYPENLFSHRWRIYYTRDEIKNLVSADLWENIKDYNPYEEIYKFNNEADTENILDRSLYSDYQTVMGFYLRRIGFLKHFGIDARFPMLDHKLIEFCAKIPSDLKINEKTDKYIFKKAMSNVLPHDIVYRKDKLGHSIPMKNWIRENNFVRNFIGDNLSNTSIAKEGFFNLNFIQNLMEQHQSKKANFSHRLWALSVLEMWLKENMG